MGGILRGGTYRRSLIGQLLKSSYLRLSGVLATLPKNTCHVQGDSSFVVVDHLGILLRLDGGCRHQMSQDVLQVGLIRLDDLKR